MYQSRKKKIHENYDKYRRRAESGEPIPELRSRFSGSFGRVVEGVVPLKPKDLSRVEPKGEGDDN